MNKRMSLALVFLILAYGGISYCQSNGMASNTVEENTDNSNAAITQNSNPENLPSISLDVSALNQMLPAKNVNDEKPKKNNNGKANKQKDKQNKIRKNKKPPQKTSNKENNESQTIIPRMSKINWIYDITSENTNSNNQSDTESINGQSPQKEEKVKEQPWHHECGRPICIPSEWMRDKSAIKEPWSRTCCQVFIYEDRRIRKVPINDL